MQLKYRSTLIEWSNSTATQKSLESDMAIVCDKFLMFKNLSAVPYRYTHAESFTYCPIYSYQICNTIARVFHCMHACTISYLHVYCKPCGQRITAFYQFSKSVTSLKCGISYLLRIKVLSKTLISSVP